MLGVFILALFIAKINHYSIKPLLRCLWIYPIVLLEVIHIGFQITVFNGDYFYTQFAPQLKALSLYALILPMLRYHLYTPGFIGSLCIFIGTALNKLVILANGGKMPVFPTLSYATGLVRPDSFEQTHTLHILGTSHTNLKILTDYIDLGYAILSIGDVFIHAFTLIIFYYTIKALNTSHKASSLQKY